MAEGEVRHALPRMALCGIRSAKNPALILHTGMFVNFAFPSASPSLIAYGIADVRHSVSI